MTEAENGVVPEWIAMCAACFAAVDTRPVKGGGRPEGAEIESGVWVCSSDCWETIVEKESEMSEPIYQQIESIWMGAWQRELGPDVTLTEEEQAMLHGLRTECHDSIEAGFALACSRLVALTGDTTTASDMMQEAFRCQDQVLRVAEWDDEDLGRFDEIFTGDPENWPKSYQDLECGS